MIECKWKHEEINHEEDIENFRKLSDNEKRIVIVGLSAHVDVSLRAAIAESPHILIVDNNLSPEDSVYEIKREMLNIAYDLPRLEKVKEDGWYRKFEKRRYK